MLGVNSITVVLVGSVGSGTRPPAANLEKKNCEGINK